MRHYGTIIGLLMMGMWAGCVPTPETVNSDIVVDTDEIDVLLDRYTDSQRDFGNSIEILSDGPSAEEAYKDLIDNAQQAIHIQMLNINDDAGRARNVGMEMCERLAARASAGVDVRLVLDLLLQTLEQRVDADPRLEDVLTDAGAIVHYFVAPWPVPLIDRPFYRTHKKLLVADGQRAIAGGANLGYRYLGEDQWRDTNVLLAGPVVRTLHQQFIRDWQTQTGQVLEEWQDAPTPSAAGDWAVRAVDQRPAEADHDINNLVVIALRLAQESVLISAPYFDPTDWLVDELAAAAARGVDVRILTNSEAAVDVPMSYAVTAYWFAPMLGDGVRMSLWDRAGHTLHSKVMVVDDRLAMIGSYNFDYRGIMWDTELAIVLTDSEGVQQMREILDEDFAQPWCFEVTWEWLNQQSSDVLDSWNFSHNFAVLF